MINSDQIKDAQSRIADLYKFLQIEKKKIEIANDEEKTAAPEFWDNPKEAESFMKQLRSKKKWVDDYEEIFSRFEDVQVLMDFAKEDPDSEKELEQAFPVLLEKIEDLEFKNMLSNEGDELSAVLQITAGAGGTESCDWASMLMRMYSMFAPMARRRTTWRAAFSSMCCHALEMGPPRRLCSIKSWQQLTLRTCAR